MTSEYSYTARTPEGQLVKGKVKASSRIDVAEGIRKQGYYVVSIEENKDLDLKKILGFFNRVKMKELAVLSRQFSVLIQAGVSIVQCLDILLNQVVNKSLKRALQEISQDVEVGISFSESLEKQDDTFPRLYSRMVNAGEVGGILDVVMNRLADYYERENELRSKIRSSMMYPLVVLGVAVLVVVFLLTTVVPVYVNLFSSMGGTLPLITRFVMGISSVLAQYWYLIMIFGFILVVTLMSYLKTPSGKYKFHRLQLRIPVVRSMIIKIEVARFTRTLGSLLASGVPLLESLQVVERIISNQVISGQLTEARLKVQEGQRLSEPLQESTVFPKMMTQMLLVGEETGTMDEMMEKIAYFYDKETENSIETAMSLLEPAMIIIIAVLIGFIVVAMIMPMFDMVNLV
ncbi:MAG: type II secretion system F family protein [Halanaerobiales bacterium]|nr:type II secretion system F family protein [Halanaerobiales bacterium]